MSDTKKLPTIAELEKILEENQGKVEILPSGEMQVNAELSRLRANINEAMAYIVEQECTCDGDYDSHAERYRGQCARCKTIDAIKE